MCRDWHILISMICILFHRIVDRAAPIKQRPCVWSSYFSMLFKQETGTSICMCRNECLTAYCLCRIFKDFVRLLSFHCGTQPSICNSRALFQQVQSTLSLFQASKPKFLLLLYVTARHVPVYSTVPNSTSYRLSGLLWSASMLSLFEVPDMLSSLPIYRQLILAIAPL